MEFVDIVENARLAEDGKRNHSGAKIADRQAIRTRISENVIGGLSAAASGHVLAHDSWVTRDIFLQKWKQRSHSQIACTAGIAPLNDRNRLSLKE
jgi:hypothetical protein